MSITFYSGIYLVSKNRGQYIGNNIDNLWNSSHRISCSHRDYYIFESERCITDDQFAGYGNVRHRIGPDSSNDSGV